MNSCIFPEVSAAVSGRTRGMLREKMLKLFTVSFKPTGRPGGKRDFFSGSCVETLPFIAIWFLSFGGGFMGSCSFSTEKVAIKKFGQEKKTPCFQKTEV